jgi:hypothetical protein
MNELKKNIPDGSSTGGSNARRNALVVDQPVDDTPGGDMENIRKILKKLEQVPRLINPLNENQLRELIASMCNPRQVELPNLVTHYIAVKEYVHSCLT